MKRWILYLLVATPLLAGPGLTLPDPAFVSRFKQSSGGGGGGNITTGLVTWWLLTEGSGTTANDSSAQGNTGTINYNAVAPLWSSTGSQYDLTLLAADSQYIVGDQTLNEATITESVWVKTVSPANNGFIMGFLNGLNSTLYDKCLYMDSSGKVYWHTYDGSQHTINSIGSISDGNWHYVVGVADGTYTTLYIDGSQVAQETCGNTYTGYSVANVYVSGMASGGSLIYNNMSLYDIRFYNFGFTSSQVTQQMGYNQP